MVCFLLLELVSQNVAMSRSLQEQEQEQKNYFLPSTGTSPSRRFYSRAPCYWLTVTTRIFLPLQTPTAARRVVRLPPAATRITMEAEATALPLAATITRLPPQETAVTLIQHTPRLRPLRATRKSLPSSLVHASESIGYCTYVIWTEIEVAGVDD